MRVLSILGSLGAHSKNLRLLEESQRAAPAGMEVVLETGLGALPHFDPDVPDDAAPEPVRRLRAQIAAADALLIACPEYGHSLPGVLKNAIDWCIPTGELERKIVAITASVPHTERGRMGLQALRQTLGAVSAEVVWSEPIVRGEEAVLGEVLARLARAAEARAAG